MLNNIRANVRFSQVPANVDISRSTFDRDSGIKTTFNAGKLVPFYCDEVLPGDTFDVTTSALVRMSTPIFPVMDDAYLDVFYFYVPSRLVWDDFVHMIGEPKGAWYDQDQVYQVPQVELAAADNVVGGLADYFGLPVNIDLIVNALPFRCYRLIYNEYFRDQNLTDPVLVNVESTLNDTSITNELFNVSKYHDYFTSALPAPQRGPDVMIPFAGSIPVYGGSEKHGVYQYPLQMTNINGNTVVPRVLGLNEYGSVSIEESGNDFSAAEAVYPANLVANVNDLNVTINALRQAIQIQRMYERDARSGARYRELMRSHFGVTVPDATVQIPELLCQQSQRITVNQVVQTSATNEVTPQGNVAAVSKTNMLGHSFTKSFTEHGYLIGLCCVRTVHSYSQGVERLWTRKDRFSYYWPALAHLGEQPIYNSEIYMPADPEDQADAEQSVFGYQEAWAEYRYKPNKVTGYFRPGIPESLDAWHYSDYYTSKPYLSTGWMDETPVNIDRTLAVQSGVADQFLADIFVANKTTRAMPLYSVPGLMDHL